MLFCMHADDDRGTASANIYNGISIRETEWYVKRRTEVQKKRETKTEVDLDRDTDKFAGCNLIIPLIPCHGVERIRGIVLFIQIVGVFRFDLEICYSA